MIDNFYSTFLQEIQNLHPDSVLDVGCGEGFTLEKLREKGIGKKLEGVEFLEKAIEIGKKIHPKIPITKGTIYRLPYKDNMFDVVLCTEVLEHLEDPKKALSELERVCKKYAVLSVPNEPLFMLGNCLRGKNLSRFGNDREHIQHWSSGRFKKFVETKFKVVKVKRPLPWTMIIAEKK